MCNYVMYDAPYYTLLTMCTNKLMLYRHFMSFHTGFMVNFIYNHSNDN